MKVTKRENGIYIVTYRLSDGKRRRASLQTRDPDEAHAKAVLLVEAARRTTGDHAWTLGDALEDCFKRVWNGQKSDTHVRKRLDKMHRLGMTDDLLADLNKGRLIELTDILEQGGAKGSTINRYLALVSKALAEAVDLGKLAIKPRMPYRKESKGKLRWITRDEEQFLYCEAGKMWAGPDANAMAALIVVLIDTGCRLSEVLKSSRLPVKALTVHETKNGTSRTVPLTPRAREALPQVPLWTAMQAIGRFSRLRDKAGLPDVSLHTLRHTCASRLVQGGMDLYRVKEWLGHSSITVTQRYAHLNEAALDEGLSILDASLDG